MTITRRFLINWQSVLALCIIAGYVILAVSAPWIAPQDDPQNPTFLRRLPGVRPSALRIPRPPQPGAILGTTPGGWDIAYTLVWGVRPALRFGLITTLLTACTGVLIGAFSGYLEGAVGRLLMRVTDAFLTFPAIAGIYLFRYAFLVTSADVSLTFWQVAFQKLQIDPTMLALIIFSWMPYARIIHANFTTLKHTEYAMAAKVTGAPPLRIIFRHLLPNAIAPAIVLTTRDIGGMVLLEAAFTFIGLGSGLPWGTLLVSSRDWIIGPGGNPLIYWWVFVPATLILILFSIGWNLLGDGLNTALNPRRK
ncbi:MAG: ABC transporter permease [Anaerolineae bacterium]|nr:ABC transporter permease [Anaerolineae bacterium]